MRVEDGYNSWPERALFNAIILAASPNHIPQPLLEQLAVGGRLVLLVGADTKSLVLIHRTEEGDMRSELLAVSFVPMTG